MRNSPRFNAIIISLLLASVGIKLVYGVEFVAPPDREIAASIGRAMEAQGFNAVILDLAGRDAAMVERNGCLMYLVPVVAHGWHETSILRLKTEEQSSWFVWNSHIQKDHQPRVEPLARYLIAKVLRHLGIKLGYPSTIAVFASQVCPVKDVDWSLMPIIQLQGVSLSAEALLR